MAKKNSGIKAADASRVRWTYVYIGHTYSMVENRTLLFRVEDRTAGFRLDQLIPRLVPDLSRSRVQKLIRSGHVTVNDRPAPKRYLADRKSVV